ncbi:MAG TPA: M3 family metallopeptidase, partial [Melioribacteraceae bacterium]|nr:M3 family metallopeptidase [Melioribacteraceae bacterium]
MSHKLFNNLSIKVLFFMISTAILFSGNIKAQQSSELPKHSDIEAKYTWNLTDIYKTESDWEKDFNLVKEKMGKYADFKGKVGKSANDLFKTLKFDEELSITLGKLYLYASLSKDLNLADAKYQALFERISNLGAQVGTASSFIRPELVAIPEKTLEKFMNENKELVLYKKMFENLYRTKLHTLSPELEEVLALSSPVEQVPYNTFSMFTGADIQYPTVKAEDGVTDIKISDGRYYAALYSTDRSYRERVYKGFYQPYKDYKNTLLTSFTGNIKALIYNAKARKYNSTLEASLDANNIPVEVYDNLVKSVNENLTALHRWCELKKKVLNLPDFHPYDTYVTLFPSVKKEYTYEAGKELCIKALQP